MLFKIGRYLMTPGAKMAFLAFALVFLSWLQMNTRSM